MRQSHQIGARVWTISVPLWRSRSAESSRRPWRARCPPGRLSRSPAPMPPFRTIVTTSGQRARAPHQGSPVGLGTSRCPARCRGTTDGTCVEQDLPRRRPLTAGLVFDAADGPTGQKSVVDGGCGLRPRRARHQLLGADSHPRISQSGERKREAEAGRSGEERAGPGGPSSYPAPRSTALDSRVGGGIKKYSELGG
jgi:hypothetical protein